MPTDHADAEVVAQEIEEPDGPQQGEGHGQHDDAHLDERAGVQIEKQKDQDQGDGDDNLQPLIGGLHVFELAAPEEGVARRHLQAGGDGLLGLLDIGAHVDIRRCPQRSRRSAGSLRF